MALVLLAGAGLMIRSFFNLQKVRLGFDPDQVVAMAIQLPTARYDKDEKINAFYDQLLERVRTLPGVASASTIQNPPFGRSQWTTSIHLTGTPAAEPGRELNTEANAVSPGTFAALRMPIQQGRDFTADDGPDKPVVVVVDQAFARKFFPNGDAVGKQIDNNIVDDEKAPPMTIIGIVPTTRTSALQTEPEFVQMYYSATQMNAAERVLLVRSAAGNPLAIASAIKRELATLDPDQPIANVRTLDDNVASSLASHRLTMTLLGSFAALALALAAIGLYGVMSLSVAQRTREMGIRLALGAEARDIFGMVLRQGLSLVGIGVGLGVTGALLLAKIMHSLLFGVSIADPPVFIVVSLTLGVCAFVACWLPARRATRVDPMVALRTD
jgi:putative ABC transport system permease protein